MFKSARMNHGPQFRSNANLTGYCPNIDRKLIIPDLPPAGKWAILSKCLLTTHLPPDRPAHPPPHRRCKVAPAEVDTTARTGLMSFDTSELPLRFAPMALPTWNPGPGVDSAPSNVYHQTLGAFFPRINR